MKKFISALLAAFMVISASGIMLVSAAGATFQVGTNIIASGTVTDKPTTVETGIEGITVTYGADTWASGKASVTSTAGNKYTGSMKGNANPKPAEGVGTYFSFTLADTVADGEIEFACEVGKGKGLCITDNGKLLDNYNEVTYSNTSNTKVYPVIAVKGGHTYTIYVSGSKMTFYGMTYRIVDKQKEFAEEIAAFPFDTIKGINSDINHVDSDLNLIQSYASKFGACDVRWETSNSSVIANDGNVNCQKTETKVTISGIFSVQEDDSLVETKSFDVTVVADADDASAVAAAKEALTLGDTSSVKNNLTLPAEGKRGTAITWKSSNTSVIENDGTVHRAAGTSQTATLTATITRGTESAVKDFTITVTEFVAVTIESYSYSDAKDAPRFTPVDGGKLKSINATKCEELSGDSNSIIAAVYKADGALKDCKMLDINSMPLDKSTRLEVDLPMDSTDTFRVFALNMKSLQPYISPYKPDDTLTENATIYIVGDSTASPYGDDEYPKKGWAQMLSGYFDSGVKTNDLALSGRSSLNFKKEANYNTLKTKIKKGDYLIIQFGHNDQKDGADKHTEPGGDRFTNGSYKKSMFEFVQLAWDKGAHPILATSISRRRTNDAGLEAYVKDTRELAHELSLPCIDLYAKTNGWINEVGTEQAKDMFDYVKAYDSRFIDYAGFSKSKIYTIGTEDNTHLNINGADLIAQWAVDEMKEMQIPVTQKLNSHRATYPLPSFANATSKK